MRAVLLRAVEELSGSASWAWNLATDRVVWSENLFRLLGLEPGEIEPSSGETVRFVHDADRAHLQASLEAVRRGEQIEELYYRIVRVDGSVRFLHASVAKRLPAGGSELLVGWLRDLTETRHTERELAAHIAVTDALGQWDGFPSGARRLLRGLTLALGFSGGALWIPVDRALAAKVTWGLAGLESFATEAAAVRLRPGQGLAGQAWEARQPLTSSAVSEDRGYVFHDQAAAAGLQGAVAIPLLTQEDVLAVIGLAGQEYLEPTERLRATLTGIGWEVGDFLSRRRAEIEGTALSDRERELLQLAAEGLSGPQIAEHLHLSPSTIKTHFENIYAKYEVPDRVAAVAKALREGLIH